MHIGVDKMTSNLLIDRWAELPSDELRLLLRETIGGLGQIEKEDSQKKLYIPEGRNRCKVVLTYTDHKITKIEPGPAFSRDEWQSISEEIDKSILVGPTKVGRDVSFCSFRVDGSWRGEKSGVQILPPPSDAPRAPVEIAEHPFILEFPIKVTERYPITNFRRMREHNRLTLALNALLNARFTMQPRRADHFWASVPVEQKWWNRYLFFWRRRQNPPPKIQWVQEFYFANFGKAVVDDLSSPFSHQLMVLDDEDYYRKFGVDGQGLRVPSDLDDLLVRYSALRGEKREKFDRACYWMDMYSRLWNRTASGSFAALVSAIEALTERGDIHYFDCPTCNSPTQHEIPGANRRFGEFLEDHAPGNVLKKRRNEMYSLRSGILHGSKLMQLDQDLAFGWDLPWWNEYQLHNELAGVASIAIRNWLKR